MGECKRCAKIKRAMYRAIDELVEANGGYGSLIYDGDFIPEDGTEAEKEQASRDIELAITAVQVKTKFLGKEQE